MKKTVTVLLALGVMFSMSACDRDGGASESGLERDVALIDGRTVHCITIEGNPYGISCDWENAK